ncbi:hypothetical protein GCM10010394_22690 [Streptomyces crystallinus]|uniref:Uncharacterized protein n=1 Tax=Streptomyces crystallinus TaxID=68191 RepID=A0ABN1FKT8_9ACTN
MPSGVTCISLLRADHLAPYDTNARQVRPTQALIGAGWPSGPTFGFPPQPNGRHSVSGRVLPAGRVKHPPGYRPWRGPQRKRLPPERALDAPDEATPPRQILTQHLPPATSAR